MRFHKRVFRRRQAVRPAELELRSPRFRSFQSIQSPKTTHFAHQHQAALPNESRKLCPQNENDRKNAFSSQKLQNASARIARRRVGGLMLGRKHHCFVHCKVAVAFNGNTALILSCAEQVCILSRKQRIERREQLTTRSVVIVRLCNTLRGCNRFAEVKLNNIEFGLYISFFHGYSPYLPVMEAIAGSLATPFAS